MRITTEEKNATRERIVKVAVELFKSGGFEATTTRDIANSAEIATGTLFNYFDTKESIVAALASEAVRRSRKSLITNTDRASFEEDLFAVVASELRELKPLRKFILPFLEIALSPIIEGRRTNTDELRIGHLELVSDLARQRGLLEITPVGLQMYWSLYAGVLAFWASDKSSKQIETLALLDESMNMFAVWLRGTDKNLERDQS